MGQAEFDEISAICEIFKSPTELAFDVGHAHSQIVKSEGTIRMMTKSVTLNCPTCKRAFPFEPRRSSMPFCSEQCQMADLGRWLNEDIGLPHEASDEETEDQPPPAIREWRFD